MEALLLLAIVWLVGYLVSCTRHPYRDCPTCGDSKREYGALYSKAYRECQKCGGKGRVVRAGARYLGRNR